MRRLATNGINELRSRLNITIDHTRDFTKSRPAYLPYGPTQITTAGPTTAAAFMQSIAIVWKHASPLLSPSSFRKKRGEARPRSIPRYANNPLNECHSLISGFHIGSLVPGHPRSLAIPTKLYRLLHPVAQSRMEKGWK